MSLPNEYDQWRLDNGEVDEVCEKCEEKCEQTFEVRFLDEGFVYGGSHWYCETCKDKGLENNTIKEVL